MITSSVVALVLISSTLLPSLQQHLDLLEDCDMVKVVVHMKDRADLSLLAHDMVRQDKLTCLQSFAQRKQRSLVDFLQERRDEVGEMRSFWIFNGIALTATKQLILEIAERSDVDFVSEDAIIHLKRPEQEGSNAEGRVPEWNIVKIKADSCWNIGYDGTGTIVGMMDTGIDTSHPALQGKFIPGGWFDAVNGQPDPYDDHGHGTFALGIVCGGDGNGPFTNDIGVAPGAQFKVAKIFDSNGSAQLSWIHAGFQWFATQDVQTINNSWGTSTTTSLEFWDDCLTLRNLGVLQVFSVGSSGPGSGTAGTPGNYPTVTAAGATDSDDNIASFSSRGPAPDQSPWTDTQYWGRPDWNRIKPDIAAPGVNIRSSWPGGNYVIMSGTSWSSAHVTGAYAILLQKDSTAAYGVLYSILLDYADEPPQGAPYPNNNYGWGRVNVFAALNELGACEYRVPEAPFFSSFQIHPNPFSEKTTIQFTLGSGQYGEVNGELTVRVFDASGRSVKNFGVPAPCLSPLTAISWDGRDQTGLCVPNGIYFVEVCIGKQRETRSIVLTR